MSHALALPWRAGRHIAFIGIDGAGKSTQAGKLAYYVQQTYGPTYLAEPRIDFISKLLHILAHQHGKTGRRSYYGDHVVDFSKAFDVVRDYYANLAPLLAAGMHVVEPRAVYCRTAMALAMSGKRDKKTEQLLALIPAPDLVLWLDTKPSVALARVGKRGIDVEKLEDLEKFSHAFSAMVPGENWIRVDGNVSRSKIFAVVRTHSDNLFATQ